MKQTKRDYFDQPGDSKATTWDHVLKSEQVKQLTFNQLDKNGAPLKPPHAVPSTYHLA